MKALGRCRGGLVVAGDRMRKLARCHGILDRYLHAEELGYLGSWHIFIGINMSVAIPGYIVN